MGEPPIAPHHHINNQAPALYHPGLQTEREDGARNRNRTGTPSLARDFKSLVSTNFTIRAKRTADQKSGGASRSRTDLHGFAIRCITALLSRLCGKPLKQKGENVRTAPSVFPRNSGAGKEVRTPDLNLGKVALYQLSYSRVEGCALWRFRFFLSTPQGGFRKFFAMRVRP